jgi:hypothetical protein
VSPDTVRLGERYLLMPTVVAHERKVITAEVMLCAFRRQRIVQIHAPAVIGYDAGWASAGKY